MITKGVASVRSPVRNLKEFVDEFDHKSFVRAVVDSFRDTYGIKEDVGHLWQLMNWHSQSFPVGDIRRYRGRVRYSIYT